MENGFFKTIDYREILWQELDSRKAKSRAYSITAFARDLGIPSSTLRGALKNEHGLSGQTAEKIAHKLRFDKKQTSFLVALVESQHARSRTERLAAGKKLSRIKKAALFEPLADKELHLLENWYYPALLELISMKNFNIESASSRLGISVSECKQALNSLTQMGLVTVRDGKHIRLKTYRFAERAIPTKVIRDFHKQLLQKTLERIETDPIKLRKNLSAVFSIDADRIDEARNWLAKNYQDFIDEFATGDQANKVYAIGLHLTCLDKGN